MKLTLSLIRHKLDDCKTEIAHLEGINNHIKNVLENFPLPPRSRKIIEADCLRCSKDIQMIKSTVRNTEILWIETEGKSLG